ncbi:NADH-quinone oxidoreductase subunit NuoE [Actinoplanes sp. N902-109]|uniref:NADH-quinone oxidoreductase subunit NuoE n=1 Tax=Actinoplanes sp. (strain N902-109) TaxID=649831 RepID=UPI0003293571|nr:NADH dehydrogenase subunit E [Actinoplanes sp. N902-109]
MSETTIEFSPAAAPLADKLLTPALEILDRYPAGRERSALLPLLHLVQTEEGYVSPAGVAFCAELLRINKAQVGAVATFYTMYKRRPTGDYLISVCTNTLCNVLGGQEVYDTLVEHLGVGHDETTADGSITLEHAECLAACDYAPVVTVNYDYAIDQATPDAAVGLAEQLRRGERPTPSRGARICTLKEMQIQLAGFADEREGAVADGRAGAPSLRGVSLAQEHGVAVADYNLDTPIPTTKPARDEGAKAVKDAARPQPGPEPAKPESKLAGVAHRAVDAVKAVVDKAERAVEHRREGQHATHAGESVQRGDVKDPEVRAAEARNADAATPGPATADEGSRPRSGPGPANPAEATAAGDNAAAGDGKPAGDSERGESIVSDANAAHRTSDQPTGRDNPGWQNAQRQSGNEETK